MNPGIIEIKDAVSDTRVKVKPDLSILNENAIVVTTNRLGQALTSSSHPIVIASNQPPIEIIAESISSNPVKLGGVFNSTLPNITNAPSRIDCQIDNVGALRVAIVSDSSVGGGSTQCGSPNDNANQNVALWAFNQRGKFNNNTWDKERNNIEGILLASATRTTSTNTADQTNYNNESVTVILNVSALSEFPSIVLNIEGKDPASGNYFTILQSAAVTSTDIYVYKIGPKLNQPVANYTANSLIPRTWRVSVAGPTTGAITYSVGVCLN